MQSKYEVVISAKAPLQGGAPGAAGAQGATSPGAGGTLPGGKAQPRATPTGSAAPITLTSTLKQMSLFKEMNEHLKNMNRVAKQGSEQMKKDMKILQNEVKSGGVGGVARAAAGAANTAGGMAIQGTLAAVPIVGAVTGVLGFLMNEIYKAGNAYIQSASKQAQTAGVGGFRTTGRGMMGPSELAEYTKEMRMAAGRYNVKGFTGTESTSEVYRRQFGVGAGQMGQFMGLMNLSTQGKGEKTFEKIMSRVLEQGQELQAPKLMQELTQQMEKWSAEGIKISNVDEFARDITTMNRYNFTGNVQAAIGVRQGIAQQFETVHKGGQLTGAMGYRAYREATRPDFIRKHAEILKGMGVTEADLKDLTPQKRMMFGQLLAANPQAQSDIEQRYFGDIANQVLGKTGDKFKGQPAGAWAALQARMKGMPGYEQTTPEQVRMMFGKELEKRGLITPEARKPKTTEEWAKKVTERLAKPEEGRKIEISREVRSLNIASEEAAKAVVKFENSLSKMVAQGAEPAAKGIEILTNSMGSMTDWAVNKASELDKKFNNKESHWPLF